METLEHRWMLAGFNGSRDVGFVTTQSQDEGGNTFGTATDIGEIPALFTVEDRIGDPGDDADVFEFNVSSPIRAWFQLSNTTQDIDLYLFRGTSVVGRDYQPAGIREQFDVFLETGTYSVLIIPHGGVTGSYRFSMLSLAVPTNSQSETDAGNTFGSATDIGIVEQTRSFRQTLGGSDPADVYRFEITHFSAVETSIQNLTADFDLFIFDSNRELRYRNNQEGIANETITANLPSGSYYLLIHPQGSSVGSYDLTITSAPGSFEENATPPADPQPRLPVPLPDSEYFGGDRDWNINAVRAPEAWEAGYTGQGIVVAVLDTGIDRFHSDLSHAIWRNPGERARDGIDNDGNGFIDDVFGWNFASNNNNIRDANAHGTHVAGIIASARNSQGSTGIAYDAKIMPVRTLSPSGYGHNVDVAKGIRYAVDNGADIINLSFAGSYSPSILSSLRYAESRNVFVVAASGNNGASTPSYPARFSSQLSNVLSVGAHNASNLRSSFSNQVGSSGAVQVDAPGRSILSTVPGNEFALYRGTSMATPHVSALAALALSSNRDLSASQLRETIVNGAVEYIRNSDSLGGINAAMTVPMASNGMVSQAAVAATEMLFDTLPKHETNGHDELVAAAIFESENDDAKEIRRKPTALLLHDVSVKTMEQPDRASLRRDTVALENSELDLLLL